MTPIKGLYTYGSSISDIVGPTFASYEPFIVQHKEAIKSTRVETFVYGNLERQNLDVYYPPTSDSSENKSTVLVWIYGGGFVVGDKVLPGYADGLVYANIGHYFASTFGFTVVIPNYRLIAQGGRFPSGAEDLSLAINWIQNDLSQQEGYSSINLFLMGNSAGGVHLATYLLSDQFLASRRSLTFNSERVKLRAALLISTPFHFEKAPEERKPGLETYFNGRDLTTKSPLGLLKATTVESRRELAASGISLSIWNGTLDSHEEILEPTADFVREATRLGLDIPQFLLDGHNHMSPQLSLGTGDKDEEEWGQKVGQFCQQSL